MAIIPSSQLSPNETAKKRIYAAIKAGQSCSKSSFFLECAEDTDQKNTANTTAPNNSQFAGLALSKLIINDTKPFWIKRIFQRILDNCGIGTGKSYQYKQELLAVRKEMVNLQKVLLLNITLDINYIVINNNTIITYCITQKTLLDSDSFCFLTSNDITLLSSALTDAIALIDAELGNITAIHCQLTDYRLPVLQFTSNTATITNRNTNLVTAPQTELSLTFALVEYLNNHPETSKDAAITALLSFSEIEYKQVQYVSSSVYVTSTCKMDLDGAKQIYKAAKHHLSLISSHYHATTGDSKEILYKQELLSSTFNESNDCMGLNVQKGSRSNNTFFSQPWTDWTRLGGKITFQDPNSDIADVLSGITQSSRHFTIKNEFIERHALTQEHYIKEDSTISLTDAGKEFILRKYPALAMGANQATAASLGGAIVKASSALGFQFGQKYCESHFTQSTYHLVHIIDNYTLLSRIGVDYIHIEQNGRYVIVLNPDTGKCETLNINRASDGSTINYISTQLPIPLPIEITQLTQFFNVCLKIETTTAGDAIPQVIDIMTQAAYQQQQQLKIITMIAIAKEQLKNTTTTTSLTQKELSDIELSDIQAYIKKRTGRKISTDIIDDEYIALHKVKCMIEDNAWQAIKASNHPLYSKLAKKIDSHASDPCMLWMK